MKSATTQHDARRECAFHLVLGDVASGVLREATRRRILLADQILRFRDIYCVGPLNALGTPDGPRSRADYWARLNPESPPTVAEFVEEEDRYALARDVADRASLCIWVGDHSSSRLWLQRLCATLRQPADVRLIELTAAGDPARARRALGQFEAREVGRLLAQQRPLGSTEMAELAAAWCENAAVTSGVRRWSEGRISHHPDEFYDGLLLAQCTADWQPAAAVIASAQWECDEFLGDIFFAWRLRCLAHAGRLEWLGPLEKLDRSAVVRAVSS